MRALVIAGVLCAALAGSAQAGDGPLAQMNFFQGCWRGQFSDAANVTDDRCFEPMQGGQYVRDTHAVHGGAGAYSGETIYYLDAQAHRLAFTYYASDGGMSRGFAESDSKGGLVFAPGTYVGADGSTLTMRATWVADGRDRYIATAEVQENGQWRPHLRILYTRARDLNAPVSR